MIQRRIFVVSPFGVRETSAGVIDFDTVYRSALAPEGVAAGFIVRRIDDIVGVGGSISDHFLVELFEADLVVADLSVENANVYYELGIRQAISSSATILIAIQGTKLPFDISDYRVLFYDAREPDLATLRGVLREAFRQGVVTAPNRVNTFLTRLGATTSPGIDAAAFERDMQARIDRASNFDQLHAVWTWAKASRPLPLNAIYALASRLADVRGFATSVEVLRRAAEEHPNDFEIHRTLGWHLRLSDRDDEALASFEQALVLNSSDPETLGMMGGLFKRRKDFPRALELYERGVRIARHSPYMRVNMAALSILASPSAPQRGLSEYASLVADDVAGATALDIWSELVRGEAHFALGDDAAAEQHYRNASSAGAGPQQLRSAADQLELFAEVGFRREAALVHARRLRTSAGDAPLASSNDNAPLHAESLAGPVFLHLSDVHFGSIMRDGAERDMHRFRDGEYDRPLQEYLRDDFTGPTARFRDLKDRLWIVVSGDITYRAEDAEYARARAFLEALCTALDVPRERFVLIPGNHDVHWGTAKTHPSRRFDGFLELAQTFYGEPVFRQRFPLVTWDFRVGSPRPSASEILYFASQGGVTVLGLNSCVFEDHQEHWGYIGGKQLRLANKLLSAVEDRLRVATFHHHLHPVPEPFDATSATGIGVDASTVRDAGLVERWLLKQRFDILLHGHKHKPQIRETLIRDRSDQERETRTLIVCGNGSTGVNANELEHHVPNHYGVILVERMPRAKGASFLRIEWRELAVTPGAEWITSGSWSVVG